ncbi:MAG TPA: class I SAM-dependent methyltransferase, partial [Nitrospirota bacterium]
TPAALEKQYDFITASEVVEHLREPRKELDRLWQCLKPGGTLGIMTKFVVDKGTFPEWHYKNDRTHICFFSQPTFTWLTGRWGADIAFPTNDVVLITKRAAGREAAPDREKTAS